MPDLDARNTGRIARDAAGRVLRARDGDTVPFDPITLNMGRRTGTGSQAHAHYGLNHEPKSSSAGTLRKTPWNYANAIGFGDSVATYAEDNAQIYTDLSYLALLGDAPGGRTLSLFWAGNAFHYIGDVGNAVHTLQVGGFSFFLDATLYRAWRRLVTLFGLLGKTPTRNSIGIDLITSHHLLGEELFQVQMREALRLEAAGHGDSIRPPMRRALDALQHGDPAVDLRLTAALDSARRADTSACGCPRTGAVVAAAVIASGYRDGAEIYRLTRKLGVARMRRSPAVDFDTIADDDVWRFVQSPRSRGTQRTLAQFDEVQARGLSRVHDALNAWWDEYTRLATAASRRREAMINGILSRLVRERLTYLADAERRRALWIAQHGGLSVE